MSKELGPIGRSGTFLWQLDSPSGSGMNLWSGKLDANNGYSAEYAKKAAILFEAAPALLEALEAIEHALRMNFSAGTVLDENSPIRDGIRAAIALATGDKQ